VKGKLCVITGATDGIGRAAAHELAVQGAGLLIHGRDPDKGARTVAELKARSGNSAIEFLQADFGSLAEVRRLAAAIKERAPRVDVLINNAGGFFARRVLSKDGYEMTFAVNHLAPFLLTNLLLDTLKSTPQSRVVTTASAAHKGAQMLFDDLPAAGKYSGLGCYGRSKLANILFTRSLAKRLQGTAVSANCLHPGFVRTQIGRDIDASFGKLVFGLMSRFARSPEKGAQTLVYLAASPEVQGLSGGYYFDCRQISPAPAAQDDGVAERLWEVSARMVGM
jgi:NAD(P)-dependent dehydrogenase (short-subunit alcohol dehydrogenase family)